MKSTTLALASFLASSVIAQPHRHQHPHAKRQDVTWVTEWDYVTEVVDVTETIWVSSGFVPPTTSSEVPASTTSSTSSSSTTDAPAQFFQGPASSSSSSSVYVAPTPSTSSSVYVAPTPSTSSSVYVAPTPLSTYVAQVEASSSSSSTSVYVAPTTTSQSSVAPVTTSASSDTSSSSSGGASSGCTSGSPCEGDITYFQAGLGACGWTTDGDTEKIVALPVGLMGSQSNGNPYCGQTITIKCSATGKTTTAKVVDKCMGCTGNSIDLSNAAFLELDDLSVGRTTAEWWFN